MIFGKTLVCRDLKTATEFANQYNLDCMTIDGDKAASKGWLHGGYFDSKRSSMKTYNDGVNIFKEMKALENVILDIKEEIRKVDNELTLCINEIQCIDAKANKDRYSNVIANIMYSHYSFFIIMYFFIKLDRIFRRFKNNI